MPDHELEVPQDRYSKAEFEACKKAIRACTDLGALRKFYREARFEHDLYALSAIAHMRANCLIKQRGRR